MIRLTFLTRMNDSRLGVQASALNRAGQWNPALAGGRLDQGDRYAHRAQRFLDVLGQILVRDDLVNRRKRHNA